MGNDSASAYGTGISLQGQMPDYSNTIFKLRAFQSREKAREKEPLIKTTDFKPLTDNLLPLFNAQATKVLQQYATDFQALQQKYGSHNNRAINEMAMNKWKYQSALNDIKANNDNAKNYLMLPQNKYLVDTGHQQRVAQLAYNPYTTSEQWVQGVNDADNGITGGQDYSVHVPLIPNLNVEDVVLKHAKDTQLVEGPWTPQGNGLQGRKKTVTVTDAGKDLAAHEVADNPDLWANFRMKNAAWLKQNYPEAYTLNPKDPALASQQMLQAARERLPFPTQESTETRAVPRPVAEKTNPEAAAAKAKAWHTAGGNSVSNGTNIIHRDVHSIGDDKTVETYVYSKKDARDNVPMTFRLAGSDATVNGVLTRVVVPEDGTPPTIYVSDPKDGVEYDVPYTPQNASKIENEYGMNVFQARKAITGQSEFGKGAKTASVKNSGGAAKPSTKAMITVEVNGQRGTIPKDSWAAFNKKYKTAKIIQ